MTSKRGPGLIAGYLAGPADKLATIGRAGELLILPVTVCCAAIDGAHQVICPSEQQINRRALAARLAVQP